MTLTRRRFVLSLLAAGNIPMSVFASSPFAALELGSGTRAYLFCYFRGGWDLTLSLDPRGEAPYSAVDGTPLGPALGPLMHLTHRLAVVRGLDMGTMTHESGLARFLTGRSSWRRGSRGGDELLARGEAVVTFGGGRESVEDRAAEALRALTAGPGRVVMVEVASGLDTHGRDQSRQLPEQRRGFAVMARMADSLAARRHPSGGSWLDRTVLLGFSELGRDARFNGRGGRDHGPSNGCLLMGAGIRPGVVGATSHAKMRPLPVDLATGRVTRAGRLINPEHVLEALLVDGGAPERLGVTPLSAILARA